MNLPLLIVLMGVIATGDPPPLLPPPVIAGVFPPGVAAGGPVATWTVTGRHLRGATALVVDPPDGLEITLLTVGPSGESLTVGVTADRAAAPGIRTVRVDGPGGLSNLALVRVDDLSPTPEIEPNDAIPPASTLVGASVVGTLGALHVDRLTIAGTPGEVVTLDWELRRLGVALEPVLTITGLADGAGRQLRGDPGIDRDVRSTVVIPDSGRFAVELRDNTYRGSPRAGYRLRLVPGPAPTRDVEPDDPRLNRPEPIPLGPIPLALRGTIAAPGEVDRLRVDARAGDRLRVRVVAALLGSALDSVVTLRDARDQVLAENDDPPPPPVILPPTTPDGSPSPDSLTDWPVPTDGPITVEVADRSQAGGPGFGYLLEVGPPVVDFDLFLLPDPASGDPARLLRAVLDPATVAPPGASGAFNLRAGTTTPVPFVIVPRGRPGVVEVRAEGLPPGITAEPVVIRLAPEPRPGSAAAATSPWDAPPVVDALHLRVARDALLARGTFRVVARTRARAGSPPTEHPATLVVGVAAPINPGDRPVLHRPTTFPLRILAQPDPPK